MAPPSRSNPLTHLRDRPHGVTLEIDLDLSHRLRLDSIAVKGLWGFWPACCAPAARAGYWSFRAPGAKKRARDQSRIIKIPFKNILQHSLSTHHPKESIDQLQINAVKGLYSFWPACCAPAARAGYVLLGPRSVFKAKEPHLRDLKHM